MIVEKLFATGELLDDAAVDEIFTEEARDVEMVMNSDDAGYIAQRRKLLGPNADVTHPEFGRPNRPEETFGMFYRVEETLTARILETDAEGNKTSFPIHKYKIDEYLTDVDNNLVQLEDL